MLETTQSVLGNKEMVCEGFDNSCIVLRSKGLKDATCMGWFGDDWDCLVGCPPKAIIT